MGTREDLDLSASDLRPIEGLSEADLDTIIEAITGLNYAKVFSDTPIDEFAADVSETMRSLSLPKFPKSQEQTDKFRERIKSFLSIGEVVLAAKTNVLRYEHERTVRGIRVLTDARPIFGASAEEPPALMVITHTLKIAFHRSGRHEEEFFSLDEGDLKDLKEALERRRCPARVAHARGRHRDLHRLPTAGRLSRRRHPRRPGTSGRPT